MCMQRKEKIFIDGKLHSRCSTCKVLKSSDLFYRQSVNYNGLQSRCKECMIKAQADRQKKGKHIRVGINTCSCGKICDGTLVIGEKVICSNCFDDLIYGKERIEWSLPQRSHMLL